MTFHARPRRWRPDHAASKDAKIFDPLQVEDRSRPLARRGFTLESVGRQRLLRFHYMKYIFILDTTASANVKMTGLAITDPLGVKIATCHQKALSLLPSVVTSFAR